MPNFTDLTGLASVAIAAAATVQLLPGVASLAKPRLAILLVTVCVLMLIPFNGMPLAAYVRGVTGDLSITAMVLISCALLRPWCGAIESQSRLPLIILIVLAGLALYPMALGLGAYDSYRLGYGDPLFVSALLLIALVAWFRKFTLIVLSIALATIAWTTGWYESTNLWDYLLDPFVWIYALAALVGHVVKARRQTSLG